MNTYTTSAEHVHDDRPKLPLSGGHYGMPMSEYLDLFAKQLDEFADWYEAKIDTLEARIVELENK